MTHTPMPLRIETERLILTPEEPNDAEWFAELLNARGTGRRRIWATIGSWNAPSLRVADKLGFRLDHVTHDVDQDVVWMVCDR